MMNPRTAVDLIEQRHRDRPFCAHCSAPTVTIARHGAIWLECSAANEPRSGLRRLFSLDSLTAHTREQIVDTDFEMVA
jgi:ribosomal protein L37AE/L43A